MRRPNDCWSRHYCHARLRREHLLARHRLGELSKNSGPSALVGFTRLERTTSRVCPNRMLEKAGPGEIVSSGGDGPRTRRKRGRKSAHRSAQPTPIPSPPSRLVIYMTHQPPILVARNGSGLRLLIVALCILLGPTFPVAAVDLDELTVVTLARDGSWGVATAGSQGQALATAIRDCQAMAAAPNDCGAQFTTTRGGWVIANLCGDHKILVAAQTREAAEWAAILRETELKRLYVPDLPPCRRVLTVDPRGVALPGQTGQRIRSMGDAAAPIEYWVGEHGPSPG